MKLFLEDAAGILHLVADDLEDFDLTDRFCKEDLIRDINITRRTIREFENRTESLEND